MIALTKELSIIKLSLTQFKTKPKRIINFNLATNKSDFKQMCKRQNEDNSEWL